MPTNKSECPGCGSHDTERVHAEWFTDMIEETRICDACSEQFTNSYSLFGQEVDNVPKP